MNLTQMPKKRPHILISVLSTHERTGWYHPKLAMALVAMFSHAENLQRYVMTFNPAHNLMPAAAARNELGKLAMNWQVKHKGQAVDWLLMIDNDMTPPWNLLDMLGTAGPEMDILVPIFHLWHDAKSVKEGERLLPGPNNTGVRCVWSPVHRTAENATMHLDDDSPEWIELAACGTGCIFIRPRVFEKIAYPYFQYTYDENGWMTSTEDIIFVEKARAAGFRIFGNTNHVVGHWHTVNLAEVPPNLSLPHEFSVDGPECAVGSVSDNGDHPCRPCVHCSTKDTNTWIPKKRQNEACQARGR